MASSHGKTKNYAGKPNMYLWVPHFWFLRLSDSLFGNRPRKQLIAALI
jgi:hypothetical protein